MGLFDLGAGQGFAGGEFDISQLLEYLNPVGSAAAAGGPGMAGMTPEQLQLMQDKLLNSPAAQGLREEFQGTGLTPPVADQGIQPKPVQTIPVTQQPTKPPPPTLSPTTPRVPEQATQLDIAQNDAEKPTLGGAPRGAVGEALVKPEGEATDFSSKGRGASTLAQALRGVQAPAAPVLQRISSPNLPRPTAQIKSGELQALLMALNAGGGRGKVPVLGK